MTPLPINPENIQKAFNEPTYEGWKASFDEVNAFIRGEAHIDTAAPFEEMEELPTARAGRHSRRLEYEAHDGGGHQPRISKGDSW